MNNENRPYLALIAIFIVGALVGFMLKTKLKPGVTNGPDDKKITTVKYDYDFKAAKERMDKQLEELQAGQGQEVQPGEVVPVP